ncbi:MAG TPA: restriction endonuclease [Bacteroidales bacterium]|nr:MAG: restriction endonuclease [Bacteroidetes bacterium GWF2_33_38]OFY73671.1 MAG: restriction endonuclease [Bacteroidetes bacterium RIFOXYA12_FULL_33_9]OFY91772.1 MAG: restriction endonuclease [Bacteroidetes bacterium RIFOXYA2_FULL_33_7]HBF88452.1 restriction endonuclease [Bacteroidales bacterium]
MTNILKAIKNIVENPIIQVRDFYSGRNRANSVGEALENYVKDVFANSFNEQEAERNLKFNEAFSYLGNQNNPPDIILRNGDAIETKKVQSLTSALALNSSYPKSKLYVESPMLTQACKKCETWSEKDIIYVVGCTNDSDIKYLWFVYGDCFVADKEIYERIKNTISIGINSIPNVEFTETNELGKVKRVDPLGITDLRVRGMWHIENPHKIFSYLNVADNSAKFQVICLMKTEKFNSFSDEDKNSLLNLKVDNYKIADTKIKNPNNPAQLIDAKLITFKVL